MRILVLATNYAPEKTAVAPFTTGLCEHLVSQGHKLEVVTAFPYYPEWRVWDGYRGSLTRREIVRDVSLHRVWHFVPRHPSRLMHRLAFDLSFTLTFFLAGLFSRKCDLIYCVCPPPTLALSALVLSLIKRVPYVIKLTDLGSDAALSTGIMKDGLLLRVARGFERFIYARAAAVICLCQGFINRLSERGIAPEKLSLIPDWANTRSIRPMKDDGSFRSGHGIPKNAFLALYSGNFGKKQSLIDVIQAAELTRQRSDIFWMLVGDGEERILLESEIKNRRLENVKLLPLQPVEAMNQMYAAADVLLLPQRAAIEDAVIPSKLLTYMAAGRAVLACVSKKSETARQMWLARAGVVAPPQDSQALVDALLALQADPSARGQYALNARRYAELNFTKEKVLQLYDDLLIQFVSQSEWSALGTGKSSATTQATH